MSLPFGHPMLDSLFDLMLEKKYNFLKEEAKVIENNQRMRVLKQIFSQNPMFYILNSSLFVITKGWKSTRAQILNNSWK